MLNKDKCRPIVVFVYVFYSTNVAYLLHGESVPLCYESTVMRYICEVLDKKKGILTEQRQAKLYNVLRLTLS